MDSPHQATGSDGTPSPAKGAKVRIAPRKENSLPAGKDAQQPAASRPHAGILENRIRPIEPRVPFEHPLTTVPADGSGELPGKHKRIHRFKYFFKSRRRGHHRVVTFIILPLAVLLTIVFIFVILKNH
ncbi:MAG: hypothetical protein WCQ16_12785 [Verrucomicrobiae bacterium]